MIKKLELNGDFIPNVKSAVHLGNILHVTNNQECIDEGIKTFNRQANMFLSRFKKCSPSTVVAIEVRTLAFWPIKHSILELFSRFLVCMYSFYIQKWGFKKCQKLVIVAKFQKWPNIKK